MSSYLRNQAKEESDSLFFYKISPCIFPFHLRQPPLRIKNQNILLARTYFYEKMTNFAAEINISFFIPTTKLHSQVNKKAETIRFIKYASVGVSNTAITFLTFTALRAFDVDENIANGLGYIVGMVNSFCWNRQWVFRSKGGNSLMQALLFFIGALLCWGIQLVIFNALLVQQMNESLAYLIGMGFYTVLNYIFNKCVTFKKR